jgi:AcrR family transcriptional regulator
VTQPDASPQAAASVPPNTRAAETAARRRRLLEASVELATEGGYDAVQMRDVAARAQVALGTLYRHYSSKDQLLLAALADQAGTLRTRLALRPAQGDRPGERVADVLRRATRALTREPSVTAAMVTALSAPESEAASAKREVYDILRTIISDASDGTEVPDLDGIVRVLGYVWMATLSAWVGGMIDADAMASDLALAAHLLLD